MAEYMLNRYHTRREACIVKMGGECTQCGSKDSLEIDHIDPGLKEFNLAKALAGWSWARIDAELEKCELLCSVHHLEKTRRDMAVMLGRREHWEHGTLGGYRYCKCDRCKTAKRISNQNQKARREANGSEAA
jgi:hypothetical protein